MINAGRKLNHRTLIDASPLGTGKSARCKSDWVSQRYKNHRYFACGVIGAEQHCGVRKISDAATDSHRHQDPVGSSFRIFSSNASLSFSLICKDFL
jgi:proline racemase